ncbi:MAG: UDP-glucose/GDP-mannose dehydrogenase family protein [Myxococcales bacterium FL481]|nr:MAG: UDP-glucose/GDP-mannose dehydrogenase family protein [Myxococcales bacterium FL481]
MKLSVIGTGYVGLVAAAAFAEHGNDVVCADIDETKIAALRAGEIPIYEPGLEQLVRRNSEAGRLRFTTDNAEAAAHGQVIFMAVGTPTASADGAPDLSFLFKAVKQVAANIRDYTVFVNKSTVPVGTAERVARIVGEQTSERFAVVSNPEFLKEGSAVDDFMKPDRVIIGTQDDEARDVMRRLYKSFFRTTERIMFMDARSAEITKYACNAYLATRVSFINDVANLCDAAGADVEHVRRGMGSDARIGNKFLFPGAGYGGSCFPKDTRALIRTAREYGLSMSLVASAERINEAQKLVLIRKLRRHLGADLSQCTVALWGLAFKPNTDDVREAPALVVAKALLEDGAKLRVTDPEAMANFRDSLRADTDQLTVCDDPYTAAEGADALLLMTEWRQYRNPDFERLRRIMRQPALFDGRNQWDRAQVEGLGFHYEGIGR